MGTLDPQRTTEREEPPSDKDPPGQGRVRQFPNSTGLHLTLSRRLVEISDWTRKVRFSRGLSIQTPLAV
jgi:hypothetical protein